MNDILELKGLFYETDDAYYIFPGKNKKWEIYKGTALILDYTAGNDYNYTDSDYIKDLEKCTGVAEIEAHIGSIHRKVTIK